MSFSITIKSPKAMAAEAQQKVRATIESTIRAHIEDQARLMGYASASDCVSYLTSGVDHWAAEAKAFVAWRDAAWQAGLALQTKQKRRRTQLAVDDILSALPAWSPPNAP